MGCTTSFPPGAPQALPPHTVAQPPPPYQPVSLLVAAPVPVAEPPKPAFVPTILNHSRVCTDEYTLGHQLGK
jgi:hypothetical protein